MQCHKNDLWPGKLLFPDALDGKTWELLMASRISSDTGQMLWRNLSVVHDSLRKQTLSGQKKLGLTFPKLISLESQRYEMCRMCHPQRAQVLSLWNTECGEHTSLTNLNAKERMIWTTVQLRVRPWEQSYTSISSAEDRIDVKARLAFLDPSDRDCKRQADSTASQTPG